jgi:hypothetical protein
VVEKNVTSREPFATSRVSTSGSTPGTAVTLYILGSIAVIMAVTGGTAWLLTSRWPGRTQRWRTTLSALSFPLLSVFLFVLAVIVTLIDAPSVPERGTVGMVIFSLVFFLFYAVVAGLVIGIPTAIVAVRALGR